MPLRRAIDIMVCHAGWNCTLSMRVPVRECVCSSGSWRLASSAARSVASAPYSAPWRTSSSSRQAAPPRPTAPRRAGSLV
ncbi:hypothetical protein D9M68_849530 [compost metagenome]